VAPRAGIGDCGAGAEAIDLAAATLAVREQVIPPAINAENPIEGLPMPRQKSGGPVRHAMVFASALGGQNNAIVLRKVD
jgi:act minimal PKS chain-length factor (CLF/KS beta)